MGKKKQSIVVQDMDHCYVCGRPNPHIHHIIYGTSGRAKSEKYNLTIPLCYEHHEGNTGVHFNREMDNALRIMAQQSFESRFSHELWMSEFGKNYL